LEEELEKAQFAAAFGRFCNAQILILQANDYGSKAQSTVTKMLALFAKFDFEYSVLKARKDSFKVDFESVQMAEMDDYDLIIASASREYGLDDIIFGSKEQKMVRKSTKPVLLINPRADLYALCD
jgi:nucleotide-binding universal stress UspA family protein